MTLRHLKIFLAVLEYRSMTRASEALNMAQPPVSQAVAELERHYGVPLFERRGRGVDPTPAGTHLASYAAHVVRLMAGAESGLRDFSENGNLRIGASRTTGSEILPRACRRFRDEFPRAELQLWVGNTAQMVERLSQATLDAALVEGVVADDRILVEPLAEDDLVLVCPPGHPWADSGTITADDLDGAAFFVREPGSGTREAFAAAFATRNLRWTPAGEIGGTMPLLALVAEGLGSAFVSRLSARPAVESGRIVEVRVSGLDIRRVFGLAIHGNRLVTPALEAFCRAARLTAIEVLSRPGSV